MRYFFNVAGDAVISTLASDRVPGAGGDDGETPPSGFVEVTEAQFHAYEADPRSTFVDGELVAPAPLLPVLSRSAFVMLFTAPQRSAIRAYRAANPTDDEVEDFYDLLQLETGLLDLNRPAIAALVSGGLSLLVARELLTEPEAARIAAGTPPTP